MQNIIDEIRMHSWFAKEAVKEFLRKYGEALFYAAGLVFIFAIVLSFFSKVQHIGEDLSKPIPIKQALKVDTEVIKPEAVKVYKPEAKKQLKLPAKVRNDDTKVVTSAVTVDYSLRPQSVSSVLDTQTGETVTYVKEEPYPWVAMRNSGSASLAYGFKGFSPAPVVRLSVSQDVLQIKAVTLNGIANLDSDGETFVGVGGTYRW